MAEPSEHLAKSTAGGALTCRCLFYGRYDVAPAGGVGRHNHEFWHMDILQCGAGLVLLDDGPMEFGPDDCAVIPAGVYHGFDYPRLDSQWVSIKFELRGNPGPEEAWILRPAGPARQIVEALDALLVGPSIRTSPSGRMVGHLLAALLEEHLRPQPAPSQADMGQWLEQWVQQQGGRTVTVVEAAEQFGLSPSNFSARFRRSQGVSPKIAIDRARASLARQRLLYSDESVSQVAAAMGFADIYAFSRFFKRASGLSPTAFRRKVGA